MIAHVSQVYTKPPIQASFSANVASLLYLTDRPPRYDFARSRISLRSGTVPVSSVLVPGSGESNFDGTEADPFEDKSRDRNVRSKVSWTRSVCVVYRMPCAWWGTGTTWVDRNTW